MPAPAAATRPTATGDALAPAAEGRPTAGADALVPVAPEPADETGYVPMSEWIGDFDRRG